MSPVVKVAATSAPPRNRSNIASSKARSQSARSYLHEQYLKVRLNRLQKHRPKVGLKSTLIHLTARKKCSRRFASTIGPAVRATPPTLGLDSQVRPDYARNKRIAAPKT